MATVTTKIRFTGCFSILVDGVVSTRYYIQNACHGISGRGANFYGVFDTEAQKYVSPLRSLAYAKKCAANLLSKAV